MAISQAGHEPRDPELRAVYTEKVDYVEDQTLYCPVIAFLGLGEGMIIYSESKETMNTAIGIALLAIGVFATLAWTINMCQCSPAQHRRVAVDQRTPILNILPQESQPAETAQEEV